MIVWHPLCYLKWPWSEKIIHITIWISRFRHGFLWKDAQVVLCYDCFKCCIRLCQFNRYLMIPIYGNLLDLWGIRLCLRHSLRAIQRKFNILSCHRSAVPEAGIFAEFKHILRVALHLIAFCQIRNHLSFIINVQKRTVRMFHQHTRSRILLSRRIKRNNIRRLTDNDICFCDLPAFCTLRSCLSLSSGRSTCRRSCSVSTSTGCEHHCCPHKCRHRPRCCSFFHSHILPLIFRQVSHLHCPSQNL